MYILLVIGILVGIALTFISLFFYANWPEIEVKMWRLWYRVNHLRRA